MDKATIVSIVKEEFRKHTWDTFVDQPASVAQGGMFGSTEILG